MSLCIDQCGFSSDPNKQHISKVEASDWCPAFDEGGILASGGGTEDRTITLWKTSSVAYAEILSTTDRKFALWSGVYINVSFVVHMAS